MDGALNRSGERLQKDAVSTSVFTGFVWTEGRFVEYSMRRPRENCARARRTRASHAMALFVLNIAHLTTVEPLHNGHLGEMRKWPL